MFLLKLARGGSEHSFGIHVAKLAGMPGAIVDRASQILEQLEREEGVEPSAKPAPAGATQPKRRGKARISAARSEAVGGVQLSFFQLDDPVLSQVRDELLGVDINNLTPLQALTKLQDIQNILTGKHS